MSQSLSVVIITLNEEANLGRTLASVSELVKQTSGEIIVVDSGSTDRTVEIAKSLGAKVFVEPWKGYAAQKNSAIDKASGDWILSLDADEELSNIASQIIVRILGPDSDVYSHFSGVWLNAVRTKVVIKHPAVSKRNFILHGPLSKLTIE